MPGANPATTPVALDLPEVKAQYAELGGYTVGYESYPHDIDPAPLFVGLPDDRCQCGHWHRSSGRPTNNGAGSMSCG